MTALRIFFVGGLTSYRALFNWLSPWILVPTFFIAPLFQILLFAYIGRTTHLESDKFYVIGNALQYSALPCLFGMGNTISGERYQHTLPLVLATPAQRIPLFVGRALPVILNGFLVSAFALFAGGAILGVHIAAGALAPLVVVIAVTAFCCTGLGLVNAALALRVRENAVTSNILFGLLLIFCGVNVPLSTLPQWMNTVSQGLPLTHGIEAARRLADGASFGSVSGLALTELLIGCVYAVCGYVLLRVLETESRRRGSLEVA
jgi:ABC-2 type transport system permease protein